SNQRPLTNPQYGVDTDPVWSPDGTQIAFISDSDGGQDIHVIDADGGNRRNLANSRDLWVNSPAWSPDGTTIAFTATTRDEGYGQLLMMDADGENVRLVADASLRPLRLGWSPDGASLVYEMGFAFDSGRGIPALLLLDADGQNGRAIGGRGDYHESPAWSPDGLRIATTGGDGLFGNIMTMDPQGGNRRMVTDDPWGIHDWPTWSPDGRSIAYEDEGFSPPNTHTSGYGWRRSDIHVVDLDDLSVRMLTDSRDFDGMPAWSPWMVTDAAD
ncbi:hypothetical protein HOI71_23995, partial [Candidatus Poribacteria bacterium]|nr:hypothetical protein [Candidatus Poribacteria bacterium]